jgi:hypothetical protein
LFREKNEEEQMAVNAAEPGAPALREKEEEKKLEYAIGRFTWPIIAHMFCFGKGGILRARGRRTPNEFGRRHIKSAQSLV